MPQVPTCTICTDRFCDTFFVWRSGVVSATSAESRLHQLQNSFIRLSVDVQKNLTEFQLFRLNNVKQIEFNCG